MSIKNVTFYRGRPRAILSGQEEPELPCNSEDHPPPQHTHTKQPCGAVTPYSDGPGREFSALQCPNWWAQSPGVNRPGREAQPEIKEDARYYSCTHGDNFILLHNRQIQSQR
jgi:hypothetical protein